MWRRRLVATTTTLIGRHRCPAIRLLLASKPHTDARATAVPATSHRLAIETGLVGYLGGRRRVLCVRVLCAAGLRCVVRSALGQCVPGYDFFLHWRNSGFD